MAKNSIFDPTKDGVKADNSGYSSNQIDKMIGQSAAALIDDDAAGDDTVYSSAKIYSLLPEDTATGASVTITDACPDLPVVELQADINAVQEGTGDPSPDNVRPISGWDEITVTHDGTDVVISLGDNTVYGGTLNVTTGELTITHQINTFTRFDSQATAQARLPVRVYTTYDTDCYGITTKGLLCDKALPSITSEGTSDFDNVITCRMSTGTVRVIWFFMPLDIASNLSEANAWIAENPITLVYPLLTPMTITIDPHQINTNGEGSTVISCDSGDVTVTYKKLTTLS